MQAFSRIVVPIGLTGLGQLAFVALVYLVAWITYKANPLTRRLTMSVAQEARTVYEYLTTRVLPASPQALVTCQKIEEDTGVPMGEYLVTYPGIEKDTGVPMGKYGEHIGQVLGVIQQGCASRGLPPLASIAVPTGDDIPGKGYFTDLAEIQRNGNPAGWRIDDGVDRWLHAPRGFDRKAERYGYREMVQEHQRSVWAHGVWPASL